MTSYAPSPTDLTRGPAVGWTDTDAALHPGNLGRGVLWGLLLAVPFWTAIVAGVLQLV